MRAQPLLEDGAVVSFSSDVTTYAEMERANPFFGMQIAHNRQEVEDGPDGAVMLPLTERLGREELVRGYTRGGASQLRLDDELGSLTVGKAADLVVLSEDLFSRGSLRHPPGQARRSRDAGTRGARPAALRARHSASTTHSGSRPVRFISCISS